MNSNVTGTGGAEDDEEVPKKALHKSHSCSHCSVHLKNLKLVGHEACVENI